MKFTQLALSLVALATTATASARKLEHFECKTHLDYVTTENGASAIKTIAFNVLGSRSEQNTLVGGIMGWAGELAYSFEQPSYTLSEKTIVLEGRNATQVLKLFNMAQPNGKAQLFNSVRLAVKTAGGVVTATNEILSTEANDAYDVVCTSSK